MATLSKKLTLSTTWQLLSTASGITGKGSCDGGNIEIVNANTTAPVGDIPEALVFGPPIEGEVFEGQANVIDITLPKPSTGDLYVRISAGAGEIAYYINLL